MIRILILASLGVIVNANWFPSHLLNYPSGLEHLFAVKREPSTVEEEKRTVCHTEECKLIANVIKDSMNESLDPCEDFYEYACGRWTSNNPAPENATEWSLWYMVLEKVATQIENIMDTPSNPSEPFAVKIGKKWYNSCMDTDTIDKRGSEPILSTLWRHGGWPLIMEDGEWDDRIYTWQIVDDQFARLIGLNALHDLRYHSLTYIDNATIIITTPHLPSRVSRLVPSSDTVQLTDSSDENNESGEGSQEPGSKERGSEKEDENEDENDENDEGDVDASDNEEDNPSENEEEKELRKRKVAGRRMKKRLGDRRRKHRKFGVMKKHSVAKKTRRTKRDLIKHSQRKHRRVTVHKTQHHLEKKIGKSSKYGHLSVASHARMSEKKHSLKTRGSVGKKIGNKESSQRKIHRRNKHSKLTRKHDNTKARGSLVYRHEKKISHRVHHTARKSKVVDENENNNAEEGENNYTDEDENNSGDYEENGNASTSTNDEEDENDNDRSNDEENNDDENTDEDEGYSDDEDEEDDVDETAEIEARKEEYRNYVLNVSLILSKDRGIEVPRDKLMKEINDMIEFEIELATITYVESSEPLNLTLDTVQEWYDTLNSTTEKTKINWKRKIEKVFNEAGVELENDEEVVIQNPAYIEKLVSLLDKTPKKTIVNYIHWLYVEKALIAAPTELRRLLETWMNDKSSHERKRECMAGVEMTNVLGLEYVRQHFSEKIAKTARDMIDDIEKEVEYQIEQSTWMNDDTKHFILDKLVHLKKMIGYPDWYQNATMVKHFFQGLTLGPSYYENFINYIRYLKWKSLRRIVDTDPDLDEMLNPLMLNAFFMPTENSISITAVDFQSPFFALKRPWYVNFGIIGVVMAHEINHGFDDTGHLFDRKGNPMEWLSAMAEAYDKRAECFVDQFNNYSIFKDENYTVKNYGSHTAGENIADSMGLQAVFRAYRRRQRECDKPDPALPGLEKFTNDQTFFLSFANLWCETEDREALKEQAKWDVHSTARLRVIGSVSNSEDFAKAFKCPVGSPMNPQKKCNIWI